MRALLVVSKAQATVRALSIRKAGATTLTLLAVSLCGPEPGTVWRARRAVAFYDRRQDTRAGAVRPRPFCLGLKTDGPTSHNTLPHQPYVIGWVEETKRAGLKIRDLLPLGIMVLFSTRITTGSPLCAPLILYFASRCALFCALLRLLGLRPC